MGLSYHERICLLSTRHISLRHPWVGAWPAACLSALISTHVAGKVAASALQPRQPCEGPYDLAGGRRQGTPQLRRDLLTEELDESD